MKNCMLMGGLVATAFLLVIGLTANTNAVIDLLFLHVDSVVLALVLFIASAFVSSFLAIALYRMTMRFKEKVQELHESAIKLKQLSSAVTNSGSSIIIANKEGVIEYVNEKFSQLTGYSADEAVGRTLDFLSVSEENNPNKISYWNSDVLQSNWQGEIHSTRRDGSTFWSAVTISSIRNETNAISNYIISGVDISELKEANCKLEQLALFDSLTGLANRRLFIDRLTQAVSGCNRNQRSVALLFLDLDKFKRINDTLGHDAGDLLPLTVASRLKSCVRAKDTVARLGGDEFTVLLTDVKDTFSVTHVAQQILKVLKQPIKLNKHEIIVSTSIGITLAPEDSVCVDTLMKNADLALYRAKEQGRDCYYFFTEELNTQALAHLLLEQELRHALTHNEFSLSFQPQVDLRTEEIVSVEALLRWNHPTRGVIQPEEFIRVTEETGLIIAIGQWVLQNACMQIKMLQQLTGTTMKVAVNLAARQFYDPHLEKVIFDVLTTSGLDPQWLELEVTESMLMNDIDKVIYQLNRIKAAGVTITIDDFGSGYSSLRYLRKLPVDVLKVDREFVQDIPEDLHNMEITSAVIAIAHKLNLKVIAEGVENLDQRDFLLINKCDYAQGYFFSKPISFEELYTYICRNELKLTA